MGASGTANLDFGVFPGKSDASVDVTGQAGIGAGSLVETWLFPTATADHTVDEHRVETLSVMAGSVVAGTGFTVYGQNTSQLNEPTEDDADVGRNVGPVGIDRPAVISWGQGTRIYGVWKVAWVWN